MFVGEMVELLEFCGTRPLFARKCDVRIQGDMAYPRNAAFVFGHRPGSGVVVFVDLEALTAGNEEEGEHMAAGNGSDEGFLRIHVSRIGPGSRDAGRSRRSGKSQAPIEGPGVFAGIFAFEEVIGEAAFPVDGSGVIVSGHSGKVGGKMKK